MPRAAKYTPRDLLLRTMPEREVQETLRQAFILHGWRYYHTHRSQHSPAGFPDIVALKGTRGVVAELKREGKTPTLAQEEWLDAFQRVTQIEAYVWTPATLDQALEILR